MLKLQNYRARQLLFTIKLVIILLSQLFLLPVFAQDNAIEFNLDVKSNTVPLPNIFRPFIDLSGRGFSAEKSWPQSLASIEALDLWGKNIGWRGVYRIQYNLWEIHELAKDKEAQDALIANYEKVIKKISDNGGVVILNLFGTPAGLGKVLDKRSPVVDLKAYKELIKKHIKNFSCDKRYNVWYEVWNAPDLDDFFLGRKQDYLNLYKAVAECVKELKVETRIHIPVGGPSVSWWFQSIDGNTVVTPQKSLIFELIQFCYHYHLPLDFISWHAYSTDPYAEKEITRYNKTTIGLIRDWLFYFHFDRNTPLIIDEWNYDSGANLLPARAEKSHISSSFMMSRIKNMHGLGLDYQLYFSLEDFYNTKEGLRRDVGVFWFDPTSEKYKGGTKATYNMLRMMASLGQEMFILQKQEDEFVKILATKNKDAIIIILSNYINPSIALDYLSRNIASLNDSGRKILLSLIKRDALEKFINPQSKAPSIKAGKKLIGLLKKAQDLNLAAEKFKNSVRNIKIEVKNLTGDYSYQKYIIDDLCNLDCGYVPLEQKELLNAGIYRESLDLKPYSVVMIIIKQKPTEEIDVSANKSQAAVPLGTK